MKKIILKSNLSEDEALKKLGEVSKDLLAKGLISKGDEIVEGIEEKDGNSLITINADLMTKDNYKNIKSKFLEVGEVIKNDLKNFDDPTPEAEGETKNPENKNPEEEQKVVEHNKVKPAESVLHDTEELLFNINPNQKVMDDLKTLLFSEEEIKNAPESPEKRPADPKAEEQKPEEKEHDETPEGEDVNKERKEHDETPEGDERETKLHDLLFSEDELHDELELHDLLFSDEELNEDKEVKKHDANERKECPFDNREDALKELANYRRKVSEGKELTLAEKYFCDAASKHFSEEEIKEAFEKVIDKKEMKEHDDKKSFKVLCPKGNLIKDGFETEEAAKKYVLENKIEGATVAEDKSHDDKPEDKEKKDTPAPKEDPKDAPENDPKPEKEEKKETLTPKNEDKPEEKREETKLEMIRRLNKQNNQNSLLGRAKEINKINK